MIFLFLVMARWAVWRALNPRWRFIVCQSLAAPPRPKLPNPRTLVVGTWTAAVRWVRVRQDNARYWDSKWEACACCGRRFHLLAEPTVDCVWVTAPESKLADLRWICGGCVAAAAERGAE